MMISVLVTAFILNVTAKGTGEFSVGGRGGKLLLVTNLNDVGAGSLQAALDAGPPRIVVDVRSPTSRSPARKRTVPPGLR